MAPVVLELLKYPEQVDLKVAVTGQHREMLDQVLSVFGITPDYDLKIMTARQTLAGMTVKILEGLDSIINEVKPDVLLAQGDTTTTFVSSLAAFYHKVAFGHVEAGLRTDNKYDPFPEEMNRRLTGSLADFHFAPTEQARQNLLKEGVEPATVYVTGNTVIDSLQQIAARDYRPDDETLAKLMNGNGRLVLVTAHRRENWGEPMRNICKAVKQVVNDNPDVSVVFSLHKNPIVREVVVPELSDMDRIHLIEPPDYVPFIHLMKAAHLILTDSGGVQEEAPALGKPVLVLRKTTERPEGVEAGNAKLVGTDVEHVVSEANLLLTSDKAYGQMASVKNPYGDGSAAKQIREILFAHFLK
jgi:UDP-N-acetylglucosamine 2-epimerase